MARRAQRPRPVVLVEGVLGVTIEPVPPSPTLTMQQRRVLAFAADGLDLYQIAAVMHLSWDTVRWHLKESHRRLGVHDRGAAIRRALELGLIAPSDKARS